MMTVKVVSSVQEIFTTTEAKEVYAPTSAGIVGILSDHTNYIAPLEIGILRIKYSVTGNNGNDIEQQIVLNGGIIQVMDNEVLVLADEATKTEEIIRSEVDQAVKNAQRKLAAPLEPEELIKLEKLLRYEKFKQEHISS